MGRNEYQKQGLFVGGVSETLKGNLDQITKTLGIDYNGIPSRAATVRWLIGLPPEALKELQEKYPVEDSDDKSN